MTMMQISLLAVGCFLVGLLIGHEVSREAHFKLGVKTGKLLARMYEDSKEKGSDE